MNVRLTALSIILIGSASTSLSPAFAGEAQGARFTFAPNVFKLEQPRVPQDEASMGGRPVRPAMEGKVPHGSSFLGLDPHFLAPAPAPVPATRTQAAMRPSAVPVAPTSINSPFRPNFGQPTAPPIAALPKTLPSFGSPSALPQPSSNKSVAGKLTPPKPQSTLANKSVHGRMLHPQKANGQSANPALALKPVATYGNMGYVPDRYLPVSSGSRMTSITDVIGRLIPPHQKQH